MSQFSLDPGGNYLEMLREINSCGIGQSLKILYLVS